MKPKSSCRPSQTWSVLWRFAIGPAVAIAWAIGCDKIAWKRFVGTENDDLANIAGAVTMGIISITLTGILLYLYTRSLRKKDRES